MRRIMRSLVCPALAMMFTCCPAGAAETVWLSSLDLTRMSAGWGKAIKDKAVQGKPMSIAGRAIRFSIVFPRPAIGRSRSPPRTSPTA